MTKQQLQEELKQSMLLKDAFKTSVLRMLISAIGYLEIQKGLGYQASEEDIMSAIEKQVKQRKDSIEQYEKAGRNDLVDKEKKELELLEKYLPEQMGEEEIRNLIKEAISQTGATTMADMGNVMGALMPKTKGKADGSLVSKIVREELS
ncbi:MAG: aspartyl-tRNA amidotransferase [Candidatus Levybacteria bacterium CG_4_9_14_3_um_filter_35_16]|nr:MAG: aspartyl-tRNA amidotransferase [Candidatus Levybacteria bacterium CG22_combo_CG10-13_8_21_14_all_35_11]PIY94147.1 MAG: aspartyl-tRNA amidotransferase [Candidatus Levybacteria bacterium CG_4_10_14_0_8_um_filter_35_23]PJA00724.1 MAG: aspartyl-tRNA amidotransferase [Candidatus Levybacteria bacterium CG_4_10_14_0_2_um_filter_35_8]PJA91404.1 MAG: aspartyl-tRNA amidotransferase [Candidatus Levybacteria bacterium CG_4_9_14_3_um_filter_35_16]PJC54195.1 MAG: aspartyl-tRNA amidotransferase [Candi